MMIGKKFTLKMLHAFLFVLLAFGNGQTAGLSAEIENTGEPLSDVSGANDLEELKSHLFGGKFEEEDEFNEALALAAELGLPKQSLIEASISRYWTKGQFQKLMGILPAMEENLEHWDFAESEIFTEERELKGYYHLFRSYEAKVAGASEAFAENAKESFWNYPDLAEILAFWIDEEREMEKMANLVMPMDTVLTTSQGVKTTLGELVVDKMGLLIDFWATWCGPCMVLMPELIDKAEKLEPQGIVVAGMNTETEERAESVRKSKNIQFTWLVEPEGAPFQRLLQIDSIPRMVLVSPQGKVLYNGHPMDPALNEALRKLKVTL